VLPLALLGAGPLEEGTEAPPLAPPLLLLLLVLELLALGAAALPAP